MKIVQQKLTSDRLLICPLGDIQYGNPNFSRKKLIRHLEQVKDIAKKFRAKISFICVGDVVDLMSPSNRSAYSASGIYASSKRTIESRACIPVMEEIFKILKPYMKGKTIAYTLGHHWMWLDQKGIKDSKDRVHHQTDTWLASELGAEFTEGACLVKYEFPCGQVYKVHAQHGSGNGQSSVYGINKMSRLIAGWDVNCMVMGHTHKLGLAGTARISEEDGQLKARQIPLLTSGSFLRSYTTEDKPGYPEVGQMTPLVIGGCCLYIKASKSDILSIPMAIF